MGFEAGILDWRIEIGPLDWVVGLKAGGYAEGGEGEGDFPHVSKHR